MSEEFPLLGTPSHATGLSAVSPSGCFRVLICPLQPVNFVVGDWFSLVYCLLLGKGSRRTTPGVSGEGGGLVRYGVRRPGMRFDVVVVGVLVDSWIFGGFSFGCWLCVLFWLWWLIGLIFAILLLWVVGA